MKKNDIIIEKKNFITTSKDNILNHYDFHPKQLGRGAYGVVYKAKEKNIDGPWRAVKKIPKKNIKQPDLLINQIQLLKQLDHPAIVRLYECFQDQKNIFLVTDLCDGGQLFERLQANGNFSQHDARLLFRQMIEAINYCHHQHIAHRDLKPENFLFLNRNSMNLKLIDFGLSYQWKDSMKKQIDEKRQKKLIGTSYYIAPEIIEGSYDERCDIWSLGVILYILVTAVPPFDGEDDKQIIQSVRKHKYDIDIPEMQGVSPQCKDLIQKILVSPEKRIRIDQIFEHPWMLKQLSTKPLKVSYSKVQNFAKFSKLKKLAATYIASRMSQKEVEQLGKLFKEIDLNHDGEISIEQLKIALSDEKNKSSLQQLKEVMDSIDTDKSGTINYTQFLAFALQKDKLFKEENIKSVFRMLDKDGNGYVQRSQLEEVFKQNGMNTMNGKSIDEVILSCDKDGNGIIDYNEFKAAMLID